MIGLLLRVTSLKFKYLFILGKRKQSLGSSISTQTLISDNIHEPISVFSVNVKEIDHILWKKWKNC